MFVGAGSDGTKLTASSVLYSADRLGSRSLFCRLQIAVRKRWSVIKVLFANIHFFASFFNSCGMKTEQASEGHLAYTTNKPGKRVPFL